MDIELMKLAMQHAQATVEKDLKETIESMEDDEDYVSEVERAMEECHGFDDAFVTFRKLIIEVMEKALTQMKAGAEQ